MCHIHRTQQAVETLQAAELGTWWFVRRRACPYTRLRDTRFADAFRARPPGPERVNDGACSSDPLAHHNHPEGMKSCQMIRGKKGESELCYSVEPVVSRSYISHLHEIPPLHASCRTTPVDQTACQPRGMKKKGFP